MLRAWLQEKREEGVERVSVATVLAKLDEERAANRAATSRNDGRISITPDDLLGAWEVADYLGVDRTRPSKWKINHTTFGPDKIPFPLPYKELKTGPVWLRSQVEPLIPFVEERRRTRRVAAHNGQPVRPPTTRKQTTSKGA